MSETPKKATASPRSSRAGIASRRDAEKIIEAGRVSVNGTPISSPALNVHPVIALLLMAKNCAHLNLRGSGYITNPWACDDDPRRTGAHDDL